MEYNDPISGARLTMIKQNNEPQTNKDMKWKCSLLIFEHSNRIYEKSNDNIKEINIG